MSLVDPFIPQREQRLLRAIVMSTEDQSFSVNQLVRIGGASKSSGIKIIERFAKSGLLSEERMGNQRRLRFNPEWPLAQELRQICMKSFGVAEPIAEALAPFSNRIELAFVFRSVVKGNDHAGSDIDLMVVGEVSTMELLEALRPLKDELRRPVNFNVYAPNEWVQMQSDPVVTSIMDGPRVIIYDKLSRMA